MHGILEQSPVNKPASVNHEEERYDVCCAFLFIIQVVEAATLRCSAHSLPTSPSVIQKMKYICKNARDRLFCSPFFSLSFCLVD